MNVSKSIETDLFINTHTCSKNWYMKVIITAYIDLYVWNLFGHAKQFSNFLCAVHMKKNALNSTEEYDICVLINW